MGFFGADFGCKLTPPPCPLPVHREGGEEKRLSLLRLVPRLRSAIRTLRIGGLRSQLEICAILTRIEKKAIQLYTLIFYGS